MVDLNKIERIRPSREEALGAVRTILQYIGEDPDRPGLLKTPDRVIRAWEDDLALSYDPAYIDFQTESILGGQFEDGAENVDQMVVVKRIPFSSCCEHHMLSFSGVADVGYIPDKKILGLSKLARVVDLFSKKLQVQERLTNDIANFIAARCMPIGVGVVIEATHSCIETRGVQKHGVATVTSALRGEMLSKPEVRSEFLRLIGR